MLMDSVFIEKPLLPEREAALCAVSEEAEDVIAGLEKRGIKVLRVRRADNLPEPICSHADLQVLPLGGDLAAVNEQQEELIGELEKEGFRIIRVGEFGKEYPHDCRLNLLPIDHMLMGNTRVIPQELLVLGGFSAVNVRQGYTRCSSVLIDDNTVITDDVSIGETLLNFAKYSVIMKQKEILLEGYDHGFIGGTCGKISSSVLAFAGRIPGSEFGELLKSTLEGLGISWCELGDPALRDVGGIVPLKQRKE